MAPTHKRSSSFVVDDDDSDAQASTKPKKQLKIDKETSNGASKTDDQGDQYIDIKSDGSRRVTISEFKGSVLVNIREYYEKDGKRLPGKKGISLPVDQFNVLIEALPQLESILHHKGMILSRPEYEKEADEAGRSEQPVRRNNEEEKSGKANYESTSEEDG